MSTYQDILHSVVETKLWSLVELHAWADRIIVAAPRPAAWLTDLSLSSTFEEASAALARGMTERGLMLSDDVATLSIGLLSVQHAHGDRSRESFEREVGSVLDAYGHAQLDVESWYVATAAASLPPAITSFLAHCTERARLALAALDDLSTVLAAPLLSER